MQPQRNLVQSLKDVLLSVSHIEVCIAREKIRISSGANPEKSEMITSLHLFPPLLTDQVVATFSF